MPLQLNLYSLPVRVLRVPLNFHDSLAEKMLTSKILPLPVNSFNTINENQSQIDLMNKQEKNRPKMKFVEIELSSQLKKQLSESHDKPTQAYNN